MAMWPPVVFLITAEFLYDRVVGNAHGIVGRWSALLSVSWILPVGAAIAWLIGLKFLLSFSISWRRHLLLGDRFDPFFFKAPFWRYLAFLILTYGWLLLLFALAAAAGFAADRAGHASTVVTLTPMPLAVAVAVWAIGRQVPFFTSLTLDPPHPAWRPCVQAMRGLTLRYLAAWLLAMLPIALLDLALDLGLRHVGADPNAAAVELAEAAFRQTMLFLHFSLGATIGAATFLATVGQDRALG